MAFAGYTGWRRGECASLTWASAEDGQRIQLPGRDAKNRESRSIPVEGRLAEILERRRAARIATCPYIFHRTGHQIVEFRKSWRRACKLAGVQRLFHDLRRSAVMNLVRAGVPEKTCMAISGHKTRSIFDRYNIVNDRDMRDAMRKVESLHASP